MACSGFPGSERVRCEQLQLWAMHVGLSCTKDSLSLMFEDISRTDLRRHLTRLAEAEIDAMELAALMPNKRIERFDVYVNENLLDKSNSGSRLNVEGAKEAAQRTVAQCEHSITSE